MQRRCMNMHYAAECKGEARNLATVQRSPADSRWGYALALPAMNVLPSLFFLAALPAALLAQSPIESTFRGGLVYNNTPPTIVTLLFDINVTNTQGIIIDRLDLNMNTSGGTSGTLDVYLTAVGGTANGAAQNGALWTKVATAPVTTAGGRTTVLLPNPFAVAPGAYGVALHHINVNPVYTNPNTAPVLPLTYTNADLTLDFNTGRARPSLATDAFGGTVVGTTPRMANVAVHYTVGTVFADFTANVTRGASPLTVQFTSRAASSNPGGIVGYVWDFDGDGIPDGNGPNPIHTYANCGNYTVSLTVIDSVLPTIVTKTNYIQTDIVVPSFTNAIIAPLTVQFTDTSSPTPTSWAWDLDGDNVVDSTLQNPVFNYASASACSEVTATLTAGRACQPTATISKRIAVASTLESLFTGGTVTTTTALSSANFLDLTVTNPAGISICALHVNSSGANPVTVEVYLTPGGYAGKTTSSAPWRLAGTSAITSRGTGQRSFAPFSPSIYVPPGTYGVCIKHVGTSPAYSNLGGTRTYTNADLSFTTGAVQGEPVLSTGTLFSPRVWNGAIHYSTCGLTSEAGYGFFAAGCAGANGVPENSATSLPRLGNTMSVGFTNLPANAAIVMLGFSRTSSAFGPLPLDLTAFGAPGCFGNVRPDATNLIIGLGGRATWNLSIPASASLLCTQFYSQALVSDAAANLLGFVTSDAAAGIIGQ